jgi:biopolymer transport protein ExbD
MNEKEFDYINVIPFIDIMLVLLTIVLTTSTFIATGAIRIQLPEASAQQTETLKTLTIDIDRQGKMFVNDRPATVHQLRGSLAAVDRETPVLIRADRQVVLQHFVDVMDTVKTLDFRRVSLQTEAPR